MVKAEKKTPVAVATSFAMRIQMSPPGALVLSENCKRHAPSVAAVQSTPLLPLHATPSARCHAAPPWPRLAKKEASVGGAMPRRHVAATPSKVAHDVGPKSHAAGQSVPGVVVLLLLRKKMKRVVSLVRWTSPFLPSSPHAESATIADGPLQRLPQNVEFVAQEACRYNI
ncbi:hypothetical protein MOQ_006422 [Trypanosoma cruzi marinkellei]|uniref:Uncharacterized protein n=1 Tax=Trypanosoma cruzi marinkellei TaxID=85056 RepID=K2MVP0_TRYCR|nr:hypothetical protein MOQ_006422 [Trypanosoma cruzi marinkellei]